MFPEERQSRRSLLRAQVPGAVYFVTIRLAGSADPSTVERLRAGRLRWLRRFAARGCDPAERRPSAHKLLFGQLDDLLDRSPLSSLALPEAAASVRDELLRHDGGTYRLLAYCVMPNHVHALVRLDGDAEGDDDVLGERPDAGPLGRVLRAWKRAGGAAWHPESYSQRVRDGEELQRLADYIAYNPVKAGLARRMHEWPWCSAHDRFQADGVETAWLPAAQ